MFEVLDVLLIEQDFGASNGCSGSVVVMALPGVEFAVTAMEFEGPELDGGGYDGNESCSSSKSLPIRPKLKQPFPMLTCSVESRMRVYRYLRLYFCFPSRPKSPHNRGTNCHGNNVLFGSCLSHRQIQGAKLGPCHDQSGVNVNRA